MNGSMISDVLPEPILHQILSLLSQKDAVRTCVLSKSWRHLWYARPVINFCRNDFLACRHIGEILRCPSHLLERRRNIYRLALENTFQRYHSQKLSIENIELDMFEIDSQWISLLEKWIPILIVPEMLLKTFSLCFSRHSFSFDLPWVVFQVKNLKKLCLKRCKVNPKVCLLECLQTLYLKYVFIEVDTLEMLMSSCPLIENVFLKKCYIGLEAPNVIRIKHSNLKHFSFHAFHNNGPDIEIDAPNLISLSIEDVKLYPNYFKNLSSKFPRLEDLSVMWCKGHGDLEISSRSIKRLALSAMGDSIKASVDAPNLHDFKFLGVLPETSLTFAKTWSEWKSHVVSDSGYDEVDGDFSWFRNLGEMLRTLSESQISLDAIYEIVPFNQQIIGGEHVVVVEYLRLHLRENDVRSSPSLPRFLNGLFSVCHPRYTQTLHNHKDLFDFLCKVFMVEREKMDYFWQKDLEEVGLEVWDKETNEWNPTSLPDCEMPRKHDIRFRLKWSDD